MSKTLSTASFFLMFVLLNFPISLCSAQQFTTHLSDSTIDSLCAKYKNKPGFVKKGREVKLTCNFIARGAKQEEESILLLYRYILSSAQTISGLHDAYKAGVLPQDLSCGEFKEQSVPGGRILACESDLGEVVPFVFHADKQGTLQYIDIKLRFKSLYRSTLERAIKRGTISKFYEPYLDLQTDFFVERLRATAGTGDTVAVNGDEINIRVIKPKK